MQSHPRTVRFRVIAQLFSPTRGCFYAAPNSPYVRRSLAGRLSSTVWLSPIGLGSGLRNNSFESIMERERSTSQAIVEFLLGAKYLAAGIAHPAGAKERVVKHPKPNFVPIRYQYLEDFVRGEEHLSLVREGGEPRDISYVRPCGYLDDDYRASELCRDGRICRCRHKEWPAKDKPGDVVLDISEINASVRLVTWVVSGMAKGQAHERGKAEKRPTPSISPAIVQHPVEAVAGV